MTPLMEVHDMALAKSYPGSGIQVYECPRCGRRLAWVPTERGMQKVVYSDGDASAMHRAGPMLRVS